MQAIKCVAVGDKAVGKHSLFKSYILYVFNKPSPEYFMSIVDNYSMDVTIRGEPYTLRLFDMHGQEEYERLRPLSYPDTDVLLVCFSVVSPQSYESVKKKWLPEITHHCPKTPFLLVGTHIDLRDNASVIETLANNQQHAISYEMGEMQAKDLGAAKYVECSALTQKGVKDVFEEAVLSAMSPSEPRKRRQCTCL